MKAFATKLNRNKIVCALSAMLLAFSVSVSAADGTHFIGSPRGSKVQIQGDSTMHEWTMDGTVIGGWVKLGPGIKVDHMQANLEGAKDGKIEATAEAMIPVRSVKANAKVRADIMDGLYQEALKEKQFPKIQYKLTEMALKPGHVAGKPFELDCKGELSIAGVTNKVQFPATIERTAMDMIKIKGTAPLKMTAFGVTPPAPNIGLGLMKCADDVKIVFEWSLAEKKQ